MAAELVTDVRALKALAHPLRNRLLLLLRQDGPATATQLAARVGESSGTTSYHLRQLADHGFVVDAGGLGTGRERWWQAAQRMTSWEPADLVAQEGGREVQDEMLRLQIAGHGRVLQAWLRDRDALDPAWERSASVSDYGLRLRPEEARALADELHAVVERWIAQHPPEARPEGSEAVAVLLDVLPLTQWPA